MWFVRMGSKVTGPYTETQLRSLRQRGQFSSMHQVSTDRLRWESAAPLVQMFDSPSVTNSVWTKPRQPEGAKASADSQENSSRTWYYLDAARKQQGPCEEAEIVQLARTGVVQSATLVCRIGGGEWTAAGELPFLQGVVQKSPSGFRGMLKTGLIAAGVLLVVIPLGVYSSGILKRPSSGKGAIAPVPVANNSTSSPGEAIGGVTDNKIFAKAVGYVLGTYREPKLDGTLGAKEGQGHGTAFAITADGYMMTNRHVANMGDDDYVKKEQQKYYQGLAGVFRDKAKAATLSDEVTKMTRLMEFCTEMSRLFGKAETVVEARLKVFIDQVPFDAKIVHLSDRYDMAIIKIDRKDGPYFRLAPDNEPEQGLEIYTLGFPGIANDSRSAEDAAIEKMNRESGRAPEESILPHHLKFSRTNGTVTRVIEDTSRRWEIEHSVQTFPGNSGGPLFDTNGTVVGLHYSGISGKTGGKLNIALSVGQLKKELDEYVKSPVVWRGLR